MERRIQIARVDGFLVDVEMMCLVGYAKWLLIVSYTRPSSLSARLIWERRVSTSLK
jgi:hypothetical protein